MRTLPEGMLKDKLVKIGTSGRVGYLKLMWRSSISPLTFSSTSPSSLPGSTFDFRSTISNIEIAESRAFAESEPNALVCDIPVVAKSSAKKT